MNYFFYVLGFWGLFLFSNSKAQTIIPAPTPAIAAQWADSILLGNGIAINNITFSGLTGLTGSSIGVFSGYSAVLGLDKGIVISTGNVGTPTVPVIVDSCYKTASASLAMPGNALLDGVLSANITQDAATLQLDFHAHSDSIEFKYIFASEEYPEFVNAGFNDIFGFFINGGVYNNKNIALLPDGVTSISIDNINDDTNSTYYRSNLGCIMPNVVFDGTTWVLTAKVAVTPFTNYTLTLTIADVGDDIYDSAVFLGFGSLNSVGNPMAQPVAVANNSENLCLGESVTLTAYGSAAYLWEPGGNTTASITVSPTTSTVYTVTGTTNGVSSTAMVTVTVLPNPTLFADAGADLFLCANDSAQIQANFQSNLPAANLVYHWQPTAGLSCADCLQPFAQPAQTTTYTLTVSADSTVACPVAHAVDSVTITFFPETVLLAAGNDTTLCAGNCVSLNAPFVPNAVYTWSPVIGLTDPSARNPIACPETTTNYTLTMVEANGCKVSFQKNSVTLTVLPTQLLAADAGADATLCAGESTPLGTIAQPDQNYSWQPSASLDNPAAAQPSATPSVTTTYTLTVSQPGCSTAAIDSVTVTVLPANEPPCITAVDPLAKRRPTFELYPNPAQDVVTIRHDLPFVGEIEIFNSLGQTIVYKQLSDSAGEITLDVSNWPSGVYLCSLFAAGKLTQSVRFVVSFR